MAFDWKKTKNYIAWLLSIIVLVPFLALGALLVNFLILREVAGLSAANWVWWLLSIVLTLILTALWGFYQYKLIFKTEYNRKYSYLSYAAIGIIFVAAFLLGIISLNNRGIHSKEKARMALVSSQTGFYLQIPQKDLPPVQKVDNYLVIHLENITPEKVSVVEENTDVFGLVEIDKNTFAEDHVLKNIVQTENIRVWQNASKKELFLVYNPNTHLASTYLIPK